MWAFGTVLWELMTWRAPFEGANPYQIINIVQAAPRGSGLEVPGPEQLPAGPLGEYGPYVELVEACWERNPRLRPTFEGVVSRLRAILQAGERPGPGRRAPDALYAAGGLHAPRRTPHAPASACTPALRHTP